MFLLMPYNGHAISKAINIETTYFAAPSLRRLSLLSSNRTSGGGEMNGELMRQNSKENGRTGVAELRHDTHSTQKTKLVAVCLSRIYARGVKQTRRISSMETAVKSYRD